MPWEIFSSINYETKLSLPMVSPEKNELVTIKKA